MSKDKMVPKFIEELGKIKSPEIFFGVVRLLKVKMVKEGADGQFELKDFYELCAEAIETYAEQDKKRKKELLNILQKANEADAEEVANANNTEYTEETNPD